ncbi:MAG: hypothetical protein ACYDG2_17895, partial [Ruminiclostridium sp.]
MATNTNNYNLIKPSQEDFYNIEDQNTNMDIIDAQLKSEEEALANHNHDGRYETPAGSQAKAAAAKEYTDQKAESIGIELSEHLSDYTLQVPFAVTTGSTNTYVATLNPAPASLVVGLAVCAKINVANTGASTLNVNGLGSKS